MKFSFKSLFCLTFILLMFLSNVSCRKACRYARLPKMNGGTGFTELVVAEIAGEGFQISGYTDNYNLVITSTSLYDSIFNFRRPCGEVDFNNRFIIVSSRYINPNNEMKINSQVYISKTIPTLKFRVDYSLRNQCDGSGITRHGALFYATIPNSFLGYQILYDIRDVNPY